MPLPAMSGAEPWIGSYSPRVPSPSEALGSMPIEPAIIAASSLRMSPNRFSVTTTSNARGLRTSCIAHESTSWCVSCTSGNSSRTTRSATRRQSFEVSSTLALSTEQRRRLRLRASRAPTRTSRSTSPSVYAQRSLAKRGPLSLRPK